MYHYLVTLLFIFLNTRNAVQQQQPRQARMSIFPVLTNYQESNATLWSDTLTTPMSKTQPLIRISQVTSSSIIEEKLINNNNSQLEEQEQTSHNTVTEKSTQIPILRRIGLPKAKQSRRPTTSTTTTPKTTTEDYEDYEEESEEVEEEEPIGTSSISPLRNQIIFNQRNKLIQQIKNSSRPIVLKRTTARTTKSTIRKSTTTTPSTTVSVKKLSKNKNKLRITTATPTTTTTSTTVPSTTSSTMVRRTEKSPETETSLVSEDLPFTGAPESVGSWGSVEAGVEESNYYGQMSEPEVADHWGDGAEQEVVVHGALN